MSFQSSSGSSISHADSFIIKSDDNHTTSLPQIQQQLLRQQMSCQSKMAFRSKIKDNPETPTPYDVLFGRGKPFQRHPGNLRMLTIVQQNRSRYQNATNSNKSRIARDVIEEIRTCHLQIRFLKQLRRTDKKSNGFLAQPYCQASEDEVYKKITHALRTKKFINPLSQTEPNEQKATKLLIPTNHMQGQHVTQQSKRFGLDSEKLVANVTTEMKDRRLTRSTGQFPHLGEENCAIEKIISRNTQANEDFQHASTNNLYFSGATEDSPEIKPNEMVQFSNTYKKYLHKGHSNSTSLVFSLGIRNITSPKHFDKISVGDQKPKTCLNVGNAQHFGFDTSSACNLQLNSDSTLQSSIVDDPSVSQDDEMEFHTSEHVSKSFTADVEHSTIPNYSCNDVIPQTMKVVTSETDPLQSESIIASDDMNPTPILESRATEKTRYLFNFST